MERKYQLSRPYKFPRRAISWEGLEKMIIDNPNFAESVKSQWAQAILFLRKELKHKFWDHCKPSHPLHMLFDYNTGNVQYIIGLANTLQYLRDKTPTYPKLLSKLLSETKCRMEGLPFTEIARDIIRQGFNVELIEESESKTPDILATHLSTSTRFYIEVSRVDESNKRSRSSDQYEQFFKTLNCDEIDLQHGCQILKDLSDADMDEILSMIAQLKNKALEAEDIQVYVDSRIKIAVAHPCKTKELEHWKKENNMLDLQGAPIDFNDTWRITSQKKIQDKIKQLPLDAPGLLYFPIHYLYFLSMQVADTITEFQNILKDYPNVLGMTLFSNGITGFNEKLTCVAGIVHNTTKVDGVNRCILYIPNPGFNLSLNEEAYLALHKSYTY